MDSRADQPEVTFGSIEELLSALELETLEDLGDYFSSDLDSDVQATDAMQDYGQPGVELLLLDYGVAIVESLPLTLSECWSDLYDLEAEQQMPGLITWLEDEIELIEGFEVAIEIDESIGDQGILDAVGRRTTKGGLLAQRIPAYPYKRSLSGRSTVDDWLKQRFFRRCPGLRVSLRGWDDTLLADLRRDGDQWEMQSYGAEDHLKPRRIRVRE